MFAGVPTMWRLMNNMGTLDDANFSSLEQVYLSGEMTDEETFELITNILGFEPCNIVGMNPFSSIPVVSSTRHGEKVAPKNSVGRPAPGFEAKVVDEDGNELPRGELGQLAIRGFDGITYWHNANPTIEETQEKDLRDGWSFVDDAYVKDEDGWLWFKTRMDNMIVTGGRQVAAPEVEEVLNNHSSVVESAVIGVPDEERGELVKAFVSVTGGG